MAQKTSWSGAALSESDIITYLMGEGGAWSSWTPTVTQSGSVTGTVTRARYARYGRTIHAYCTFTVTGSGTGSNAVIIGGLPATAATSAIPCGVGLIYDNSAAANYQAVAYLASTTSVSLYSTGSTAGDPRLGAATFTAGLASSDTVNINITYEAAS